MRKHILTLIISIVLLFAAQTLLGQETATPNDTLLWLLMAVILGMSVVCIVLAGTILALIAKVKKAKAEAETEAVKAQPVVQKEDFWQRFWKKMTAAIPIARESEIDMGHDYDGIRELDNKLPPWWVYGFYLTIAISVVYMYYYHIGNDWSSDQEYQVEMAEAAKIKEAYLAKVANLVNENTVEKLEDGHEISLGKTIYMANCVACHGDQGQGGIGPNLADAYWLHGGGIKNIFKTVKYGIPEKGMIPWQDVLKPLEMQQVSSFIMTFEGTNPPNAKEAQGELWTPAPPQDSVDMVSMN